MFDNIKIAIVTRLLAKLTKEACRLIQQTLDKRGSKFVNFSEFGLMCHFLKTQQHFFFKKKVYKQLHK